MTVLDRKLRRDLYAVKGLLVTIVLIITIGIAGFISNLSLYFNLELSRRAFYAQCRMADFWIDIERFPLSELERLRNITGVSELRPRIRRSVSIDLEDVDRPVSGTVISMPLEPEPIINGIVLKSGGYFSSLERAEVIVNDAFARANQLRPGDSTHVFLNGKREELFIVGTAVAAEFVQNIPPGGFMPSNATHGILYLKKEFVEDVLDFQGAANQIVGQLAPQYRDNPEVVLKELKSLLKPFGEATTTPLKNQSSHFALREQIRQQGSVALIMPSIFLIVAAAVLNLLMIRVAEQQRTVVGTLKALGYGKRELLFHYLTFGVMIGLMGGLLGAVLGYWLSDLFTDLNRPYFEFPQLTNRFYPQVFLPCILASVILSAGGTLRGILIIIRLKPAEAMRPKPPPMAKRLLLERWPSFWNRLGFRWQMILRSMFRQRRRTLTGILAAALGTMLILTSFQLVDGVHELLAFTYEKMLVSDFDLSFASEQDYAAFLEAKRLPGVDYCEPLLAVSCTFYNGYITKKGSITGLPSNPRLTVPRDKQGNAAEIPGVGLVLTRELAKLLRVSVGETLDFVPLKGRRETIRAPVSRIVESFAGTAAYADFHYLNRLVNEAESVTGVQLKLRPDGPTTRQFYRAIKQSPIVLAANAIREEKASLEAVLAPFYVMIGVIIVFAGLICAGSILNSSLISMSERKQEIATLRVLGYGINDVSGIFFRHSMLINVVGIVLGLPLGYALSFEMCRATATELVRFPFIIQPRSWALTFVLGLVFTMMAHVPVHRAIKKSDWRSELNVQE